MSQMVFKIWGQHNFIPKIIYFVRRTITPKVDKPQLRFLHSARHLMVVNMVVEGWGQGRGWRGGVLERHAMNLWFVF